MFGPRFHLFTVWGIPIRIDLSWFIIVVLITWSLAQGLFANLHQFEWLDEAAAQALVEAPRLRWLLGLLGALGLFASVLLHELGHAKVAQRFGVPMEGITLFIFGGVAEMREEPPSPKAEFWVAIGGPLVTLVIAAAGAGVWMLSLWGQWGLGATTLIFWLTAINLVLLVFNMIPAFPLDGGRVLRSAIWAYTGRLTTATRITSGLGSAFGIFLMVVALLRVLVFDLIGALWFFLIGLFLRTAARMSYQRVLLRQALEGESLARFITREPVTVRPDMSIADLVDYFYRYHHKMYPVVRDGDEVVGCVTMAQVKDVPRERWSDTEVKDLLEGCSDENSVQLDQDPLDAMTKMHANQRSRLMVLDGDRLVGVISLKNLMDFLSLKIELEQQD